MCNRVLSIRSRVSVETSIKDERESRREGTREERGSREFRARIFRPTDYTRERGECFRLSFSFCVSPLLSRLILRIDSARSPFVSRATYQPATMTTLALRYVEESGCQPVRAAAAAAVLGYCRRMSRRGCSCQVVNSTRYTMVCKITTIIHDSTFHRAFLSTY